MRSCKPGTWTLLTIHCAMLMFMQSAVHAGIVHSCRLLDLPQLMVTSALKWKACTSTTHCESCFVSTISVGSEAQQGKKSAADETLLLYAYTKMLARHMCHTWIADRVLVVVVRNVGVGGPTAPGKLQHHHSRCTNVLSKVVHISGDHTQVLSNDGNMPQLLHKQANRYSASTNITTCTLTL